MRGPLLVYLPVILRSGVASGMQLAIRCCPKKVQLRSGAGLTVGRLEAGATNARWRRQRALRWDASEESARARGLTSWTTLGLRLGLTSWGLVSSGPVVRAPGAAGAAGALLGGLAFSRAFGRADELAAVVLGEELFAGLALYLWGAIQAVGHRVVFSWFEAD